MEYDCVLKPQRERDKFMMKLEMGTKGELCSIQHFCLCLKAETVVDVFSADGTALNESAKLSEMNSEGKQTTECMGFAPSRRLNIGGLNFTRPVSYSSGLDLWEEDRAKKTINKVRRKKDTNSSKNWNTGYATDEYGVLMRCMGDKTNTRRGEYCVQSSLWPSMITIALIKVKSRKRIYKYMNKQ